MHTPGPWNIAFGGMPHDDYAVIGSPHSDRAVCNLEPHDYNPANARLIAAAPALLDALEMMLKTHDPSDTTDAMEDAREDARAAIAAARGEGVTA